MNKAEFVSGVPEFALSKDGSGVVLGQAFLCRGREEFAASALMEFGSIGEARAWVAGQAQVGPDGRPVQVEFSPCLERWERAHWAPRNVMAGTMAFVLMG